MNKLGAAAESVRREFVTGLLKRKTLPPGGGRFLAEAILSGSWQPGRGEDVASELLGAEVRSGELLDHATEGRSQVIVLGLIFGAMESLSGRASWRGPSNWTRQYLRFLAENDYKLSPVEKVMLGDMTVDACLEEQELQ